MRAMGHIELSWLSLITHFLNSPVETGNWQKLGWVIHIPNWKAYEHTSYTCFSKIIIKKCIYTHPNTWYKYLVPHHTIPQPLHPIYIPLETLSHPHPPKPYTPCNKHPSEPYRAWEFLDNDWMAYFIWV